MGAIRPQTPNQEQSSWTSSVGSPQQDTTQAGQLPISFCRGSRALPMCRPCGERESFQIRNLGNYFLSLSTDTKNTIDKAGIDIGQDRCNLGAKYGQCMINIQCLRCRWIGRGRERETGGGTYLMQ